MLFDVGTLVLHARRAELPHPAASIGGACTRLCSSNRNHHKPTPTTPNLLPSMTSVTSPAAPLSGLTSLLLSLPPHTPNQEKERS